MTTLQIDQPVFSLVYLANSKVSAFPWFGSCAPAEEGEPHYLSRWWSVVGRDTTLPFVQLTARQVPVSLAVCGSKPCGSGPFPAKWLAQSLVEFHRISGITFAGPLNMVEHVSKAFATWKLLRGWQPRKPPWNQLWLKPPGGVDRATPNLNEALLSR